MDDARLGGRFVGGPGGAGSKARQQERGQERSNQFAA